MSDARTDGPRIGVHLQLGNGLPRAAHRAVEIGARAIQVFVDNPSAWKRRNGPPRHQAAFRERLAASDVASVAVHASYLVNLAGADPDYRRRSLEVLASDLVAGAGYGARFVNVHTGSHRDTSVAEGIERIASGVAEALARADELADAAGAAPVRTLLLENSAGGGWAVGTSVAELAEIADRAAGHRVTDDRLAFCLDTAHAWGAGVALDDPDAIDRFLDEVEGALGAGRIAMVHFNDSRAERGSRHDRHEHVGGGRIGARGLGHVLRHPKLRHAAFVLETPGMDEGYDAINLDRMRLLLAGEPLPPLPQEAFELTRGSRAAAPAEDDVAAARGGRRRRRSPAC